MTAVSWMKRICEAASGLSIADPAFSPRSEHASGNVTGSYFTFMPRCVFVGGTVYIESKYDHFR